MAINIKFDLNGNPEPPIIILANRNGNKLGQLKVNEKSIDIKDSLNDASEFSFTINKYIDDIITPLWDKIVDFKLVYCKEWDLWFEIKVELDEETETVKTVFCTQLGQAELSQIMLYNVEINTEKDIERDDYKISILWDENDPKASILDRTLEKAPHYRIIHVDDTIKNIQRSFSFDSTSILDSHQEISEEIGCLFKYHSNSGEKGKIQRDISVYDLQQNCNDCGHRGEFTDKCPKCGSANIRQGYGEDTLIFVTSDQLASEGIQLVTDTDSVKNCFKLEAGDDLMTATIRNCNPNGTDYLWYLSNAVKEDMSKELVDKLNSYDNLHKDYYNNHESKLNTNLLNKYNSLVEKYESFYNTKSTCINCDYEGFFESACPKCNSTSILSGKTLQSIPATINGYSPLMNAYYNVIDLGLYLKSGLMPTVEMSDTNAQEQVSLLTASALSPVAVTNDNIQSISLATANSAVLSMAKIVVKSTYKVEVKSSTLSADKIWEGSFVVTNYSDENDTAESQVVRVAVNNDAETFIKQKIDKALNRENVDDYSISGLFKMKYDDFCDEIKKYALNPLKSFYDACDSCLNILIDQGAGNKTENPDLYEKLYKPYYSKSSAISAEIKIREDEIAIIEGVWNKTDEKNPELITKGLQQYIEECRNEIQDTLNFEKYLGEELWLEFCAYRRDDTYSNENYISDGLNNAQLFEKALEFYEVAENEIYKSAELQHSISTSLNNLLAIDKFKPLVDSFEVGNWIRVQVDDSIFKLRLLEYEIDFGNFENIPVDFSDVTKIKNGITDVKDIIDQASSMATNYSSIQKQADQGNRAKNTVDQWIADGLNSALVRIQSNNDEEVIMTENGLLCRSYDDITGSYLPEQFKLTHNIMAYTTDNWETVSAALGKHSYKRWNGSNFVDDTDYGLSATFVSAGYISGSQIIGGEIVSSNYESGKSGTYFNLVDGDFEIAGGKIVFDESKDSLRLKNVTIEWSGTNAPEINDISGLEDYIGQLENIESQLDGRAQTWYQDTDPSVGWNDADKKLHIGDLWHYTGNTGTVNGANRVKNSEWIWKEVNNGYQWSPIEISDVVFDAIDGKAQVFVSTPMPPYYVGDLWVQGSDGDIMRCIKDRESGSYTSIDWERASKYTDDTNALEALEKAKKGIADAASAITLANTAQSSADAAQSSIDKKTTELTTNLTKAYEAYTDTKISALDTAVANYLGLGGGTLIGDSYVISPYIGGGCLDIASEDKRVIIDPKNLTNNGFIFQVHNGERVTLGIDSDGNAAFDGIVYASGGKIGGTNGWVIGNKKMYSGKETLDSGNRGIYLGTDGIHIGEGNNSFKVCVDDAINLNIVNETTYHFKDGYSYAAADMRAASRMSVGLGHDTDKYGSLSDQEILQILDIDGNGKINAMDVSLVTRKAVGLTIDNKKMAFSISKDGIALSNVDGIIFSATRYGVTATELATAVSSVSDETSDIKVKHTVESLSDEYDVLFDNLTPRRFKYNHGTSNRFHTGFIAQEIVEALEKSNLTTQDFATVVHLDTPLSNGAEWALRKEEMVALNTWQIQKLKARVVELEEKISGLINA